MHQRSQLLKAREKLDTAGGAAKRVLGSHFERKVLIAWVHHRLEYGAGFNLAR